MNVINRFTLSRISIIIVTTTVLLLLLINCLFARPLKNSEMKSAAMQIIRTDTLGGKGITLLPNSGTYTKVVLWFHGLGDTANGWSQLMPMLNLDDTKFVLPTAPIRKITLNHGAPMTGWFDMVGLDPDSKEDEAGFQESATRVNSLIQAELDKGIPSNKIFVGGFSQGGALALHVTLRSSWTLAGCAALSTWLPLRHQYPSALAPTAKSLSIIQFHGDEDHVVPFTWGHASHTILKSLQAEHGGPTPHFIKIEGMGHSSDPDEISQLKKFITERLNA